MEAGRRLRYERRVRALEAFGHRGSSSPNEHRAADYLVEQLTEIGVSGVKELFNGASSLGLRLGLHVVLSLIAASLLWTAPLISVLLGAAAVVSVVMEQSTRYRLLGRPLLNKLSHNVVGRIEAKSGTPSLRIVVMGHYDTQRTGWIWNDRLVKRLSHAFNYLPGMAKSPFFLSLVSMAATPVLGIATIIWPGASVIAVCSGVVLVLLIVTIVVLGQWAVGPYVPGAADNASGTAAVTSLGERWLAEPVEGVELVLLHTGCEEVGLLGAAAWADAHQADVEATPTLFLNIDSIGYGSPRFLQREYSLAGLRVDYKAEILEAAAQAAAELELVDAGPHKLPVATDGHAFLKRGIFGVTLLCWEENGFMPNYHQLSDTSDAMDFDIAWDAIDFCWAVLRRLATIDTAVITGPQHDVE